jgi:hypothetical protein
MPAFSHGVISHEDMDALIAYLKTSRRSAAFCTHLGPC